MLKLTALAAIVLSCAPLAGGQAEGVISGAVVDASGAPVPLASISLVLDGSLIRRQLVSDRSGKYQVAGLPAGSYTLTAWSGLDLASGEKTVVLRNGQALEATITLGDARDADSNLPFEQSNVLNLVRIVPELTPGQEGGNIEGWGPYGLRGNLGFNSYGQRSQSNSFLLDGVDNNDAWVRGPMIAPPVEEVSSVTVAAGALPAEFGDAAGAAVSIATRAGSSAYHGSTFEHWGNAALNARNFFDESKPGGGMSRFGGSVGGPVRRQKWFFFANTEILRESQGMTIVSTVPTQAQKTGAFGATPIYDPLTIHQVGINFDLRNPFPGNRIPSSRIPQASRELAALYPNELTPSVADNYATGSALGQNRSAFGARSDYHSSSHGTLFVRLSGGSVEGESPLAFPGGGSDLFQLADGVNTRSNWQGGAAGHTLRLSPSLVNEFRAGMTVYNLGALARAPNSLSTAAIPGLGTEELPYFSVSGFTSLGTPGGAPFEIREATYDASDQVSWKTGRHSWVFGMEALRRHVDGDASQWSSRGAIFFTPDFTSQPGIAGTGDAFASLLLGFPSEIRRDTQFQPYALRGWELAAFAQDSIRLGQRLTLEAGVRYSLDPPVTEADGRMVNFNFSHAAPAMNVSGGYAGVGYKKLALAPRIGFAIDLSRNGSAVIRGGFGQNYDGGEYLATGVLARNPPFASRLDLVNGTYQLGLNLSAGLPPVSAAPPPDASGFNRARGAVYAIQQGDFTPYSDQWGLSLELRPRRGLGLEVDGMGSMGMHLLASSDANQPQPAPTPFTFNRYPYNLFRYRIDYLGLAGGSTYYGGAIKAKGQPISGLQFEAGYVYGKSIDDATAPGTDQQSRPDVAQYVYYPRGARSPSPFDIAQRLIATGSYELPFHGQGNRGFGVLANWRVSAIATFQTGFPFTPELSTNTLNDGGFQLPDRVGNGALPAGERTYLDWFNTSINPNDPGRAFQVPGLYQFGNSGFDILRGPGMIDVDTAMARRFAIRERLWLDVRAEVFNFLNGTNFALPNRILGAESAGAINHTVTAARRLELTVRMDW